MDRSEMMALFARRAAAWNRHDAVTLAADHADDAVAESPLQGRIEGRANIQALYDRWFASFQDLSYTARDLVIDGNQAAQFFTIRATQSAPFAGVPATRRRLEFSGVTRFTFGPDGLITHDERLYDVTAVMVQLGVLKAKPLET
jgi:steroid delta-isomerase-like uncharacterized protein